ncbi:MAG: hypothetical protein AAF680_08485, partial [Pseudomonadota bacterium]
MLERLSKVVREVGQGAVEQKTTASIRNSVVAVCLSVIVSVPTWAQGSVDEKPNGFAMTGDLLVARPIGLAMTVVGTAAFLVSLPFTALAGSVTESAETLVIGPAETTFMRCLGCREPGYSYKDVERRKARKEADEKKAAEKR